MDKLPLFYLTSSIFRIPCLDDRNCRKMKTMSRQNLENSGNRRKLFYYIPSALTYKSQTDNFKGILSRKCSIIGR